MNYSKQREKILGVLTKHPVHPTAEVMLELLKAEGSDIGFTTLYRNLNQLANAGIIKKIEGLEASAHFDHNTCNHYHFICEDCGKIYDVPADVAPKLINNIQLAMDVEVTSHDIVFHGKCNRCKKRKENY